jgi:hypothetical protein
MLLCLARCLVVACCAGFIAGCDGISAPPTNAANAPEATSSQDSGRGDGYGYHIGYPQDVPAPLLDALHADGARWKQQLIEQHPAAADGHGYQLTIDYTVARRTAQFVSALGDGSIFLGGAHGAPVMASFNMHLGDDRLVTLPELFEDANAALLALSAEVRRQLEGRFEAQLRETTAEKDLPHELDDMRARVERGTEPTPANFAVFLVDGLDTRAIGLTLIFPPDQVASYADGPQQVEVPAKVFYKLLKTEYRDAFQIDTEADKPTAH